MNADHVAAAADKMMPGRVAAIVLDQERIGDAVFERGLFGEQTGDGGGDGAAIERDWLRVPIEAHQTVPSSSSAGSFVEANFPLIA